MVRPRGAGYGSAIPNIHMRFGACRKGETMARIFRRNPEKNKGLFRQWLLPLALCLSLAAPCAALAVDAAASTPSAQTAQRAATDAGASLHAAPTPAMPAASQVPAVAAPQDNHPWWFWPLALLGFCFILGIIAVMAGVGGGVQIGRAHV